MHEITPSPGLKGENEAPGHDPTTFAASKSIRSAETRPRPRLSELEPHQQSSDKPQELDNGSPGARPWHEALEVADFHQCSMDF